MMVGTLNLILTLITVKVSVKARKVTVTGPRGSTTKDFSHIASDIRVMKFVTAKKKGLWARIRMWNGAYKQACAVTTLKSLISNMIIGVTEVSSQKMILTPCFKWCVWTFLFYFLFLIIISYSSVHSSRDSATR